jgi:hypothetical protein
VHRAAGWVSALHWPELRPAEFLLIVLLAVIVILVALRFRSPGVWVDGLLLLGLAGAGALLKIVLTH